MTRKEFEAYLHDQKVSVELQEEYWRLYDKINEPKSPLSYNQRAYFLLNELKKMKVKKNPSVKKG